MDIKFYLPARYNPATKQFEPEMYTNLAQNVYMDIDNNETVFNAIRELQNNERTDSGSLPIGTVHAFLSTKPPPGWLACNTGDLVSRATYPDLWAWVEENAPLITESQWQAQAAVQTSVGYYSSGDGSTTFRLPRIVDFVRGSDGVRLPGKWQEDAIRNIKGSFAARWSANNLDVAGAFYMSTANSAGVSISGSNTPATTYFDASLVVPTANENRPKSIAMLYCVKAFGAPVNEGLINITELANDVARIGLLFDTLIGLIIPYGGSTLSAGLLEPNGAAISRTTYADLFARVGTTYGAGDGSTTFNLPDLRGEFIRVHDGGKGVDANRVLGSSQLDSLQGHWHATNVANYVAGQTGAGSTQTPRVGTTETIITSQPAARQPVTNGTNGTPRTASETRGRNVALKHAIVAYNPFK